MQTSTRKYERLEDLPDFCSLADLSEILPVSRATAYRLAGQGRIPCIRLGKRFIFSIEHLKQWIDRETGIIQTTEG